MSDTVFEIRYLGTGQYALELYIGPKQQINHIFTSGEYYDITNIATPDEINRNAEFTRLRAASLFTTRFTLGTTDISQLADVGGDVISDDTPATLGPAAAAGTDGRASRSDHIHGMPYGVVGSIQPAGAASAAGTAANVARTDHVHVISPATISSTMLTISETGGVSPLIVITKTFTAGVTGAADDVTIFSANAPYAFQIVDSWVYITTAVAVSTVTLRSATGGGGSAKSDDFASSATGRIPNITLSALPSSTAANGTLVLRRSDRAVAGSVVILIQKV